MAKIAITKIQVDESVYPRSGVSEFNVGRLVAAYKTGTKLPPLIVEAGTYRLVDGRHRLEMYRKLKVARIDVTEKVYRSEADLYADAVRCNVGHGEPLDQFSIRGAIIRLNDYGYSREKISSVVRLPVEQIEKITRGFAQDETSGKPVALKGGLSHLAGQPLSAQQQQVNRHYSGQKATFYANQISELLVNDMWPRSASFSAAMDRLVELWTDKASGRKDQRSSFAGLTDSPS